MKRKATGPQGQPIAGWPLQVRRKVCPSSLYFSLPQCKDTAKSHSLSVLVELQPCQQVHGDLAEEAVVLVPSLEE